MKSLGRLGNGGVRGMVRCGLAGAVLSLALAVLPVAPYSAHAQLAACRSDPVLTLSNLAQLDLQAGISDNLSDVKNVAYVVHAPAGTSLLSVVNLDPLLGVPGTLKFYADNPSGVYDLYTTVYTGKSGIAVTADEVVVSPLGVALAAPSVSGLSGQTLHTRVKSLL